MNIRMMPPASPAQYALTGTMTVNGRQYSAAQGSTLDVPDFDANILEANGWLHLGSVGPTASRPAADSLPQGIQSIGAGYRFIDTTLGAAIVFTGLGWVNAVTGAAA